MNLKNRIKKLENQAGQIECTCLRMVRFTIEGKTSSLCSKCVKDIQTGKAEIVLVLPSLDEMPIGFQNFKGKVYAGFNPDLV